MCGNAGASNSSRSAGLSTKDYSIGGMNMTEQVQLFELTVADENKINAFKKYAGGVVGGVKKADFDEKNGLSEFIDSKAADPIRLKNNVPLYRGGTITEEEFNNLKVGQSLNVMDSQNQLTSWSTRELTAHMYAEESKLVWGQGGSKSKDIVLVDTSKTNDAVILPYTYPHFEVLRSRTKNYTITKIVDQSQYEKPIGREQDSTEYYTKPVTYIYVKSR